MSPEHIQKEKEYGIPWRSAFKVETNQVSKDLRDKIFGKKENDSEEVVEDPFHLLGGIVHRMFKDAESMD